MTGKIVFVSEDLMFWAQVREAGSRSGVTVERVQDEASLTASLEAGATSKVLIDLEIGGFDPVSWARRRKSGPDSPTLIAFGSHVDDARLREAEESGIDVVMPRSRFHRSIVSLVCGG